MRHTTCRKPLISCVAPSLVEVEVVYLGYWFAPSLVEVEACGLLPLVRGGVVVCKPSSVEVLVVVWLRAYPSVVRRCLREEFGTPGCKNPSR